jgi:hypothetical protein
MVKLMTTPADTDKSRFVATALGLNKPVCCDGVWSHEPKPHCPRCGARVQWNTPVLQGESYTTEPHDIPPPDFLSPAGADLLLRTLLEKGYFIHFGAGKCRISVTANGDIVARFNAPGNDYKSALLDAAYRLLKTDDRKTMEGM